MEAVLDRFTELLDAQGGGGAAFAVHDGSRFLVDLWGGVADERAGRPWTESTTQLIFSGTKGLVAASLLPLLEDGRLQLDAPLSRYWPEFGDGADEVRVEHVLSHTAGLPAIRRRTLQPDDLLDAESMAAAIAVERPIWRPGAALCYHALTFGWLVDGLVRRVTGRSVGSLFAEQIAAPLGLELWIGLPPGQQERVARLRLADDWGRLVTTDRERMRGNELLLAIYDNPRGLWFDERFDWWNRPAVAAAEIPGVNAIGTARSVAALYGCLANGGTRGSHRLLRAQTVLDARRCLARGHGRGTGQAMAYGSGFALQTEERVFGPPDDAFGHPGAGGSVHGAWPSVGLGFSFASNVMRDDAVDRRAARLLAALDDACR